MTGKKVKPQRRSSPYQDLLRSMINEAPDVFLVPICERHGGEFRRIHKALNVEARENRGLEQVVAPIIGPSQSGKSAAILHYIDKGVTLSKPPKGRLPALRVNLSPRLSGPAAQGWGEGSKATKKEDGDGR